MSGSAWYNVAAYAIGLALMWGYAAGLWATCRRLRSDRPHRAANEKR